MSWPVVQWVVSLPMTGEVDVAGVLSRRNPRHVDLGRKGGGRAAVKPRCGLPPTRRTPFRRPMIAANRPSWSCAPGATRQSIGIFWSPRLDATLDALPLPPALAAEAPGVSQHEHNALLPRFGDNALKGWLRSHPEVAARHHPDLVAAG